MFFKKKKKEESSEKKKIIRRAGIYIDSQAIYLKIAERRGEKGIFLEELEYPVSLGSDTFADYKIGFEKVNRMMKGLMGFVKTIEQYNIDKSTIIIVATTAIRAAKNKEYILDQINVKTGLNVEVLSDNAEKFIIYRGINGKIEKALKGKLEEKTLLSYIGTGRLGIGIYSDKLITATQNIRVGSLKLTEILGKIQEETDKFYLVVEEYLTSFAYMLQSFLPTKELINYIATGKNLGLIAKLCKTEDIDGVSYISKKDFNDFYEKIKDKTPNQVSEIYGMNIESSEILLPSMAIYKALWEFTNARKMIALDIDLLEVLLNEELFSSKVDISKEVLKESTIISAKNVGKKYDYNEKHANVVERFSLKLFDKLKEVHGLNQRDRLLLQMAAILHDIGKFISLKNHYDHSYDLIRSSHIFGLTNEELEIVANVSKYHSITIPSKEDSNYKKLNKKERMLVSKLSALLRLVDSLDRAHKCKVKDIEVYLQDKDLIIEAISDEPLLLEKWVFDSKTKLFEQIFGIKTKLKRKGIR